MRATIGANARRTAPASARRLHGLNAAVAALVKAAGGMGKFAQDFPQIFRKAIDEVIDAPRTNRFTLSETEKTEKTYLGTKIEILLRAHLGLQKRRIFDLAIGGVETDIKNTMGGNWTIIHQLRTKQRDGNRPFAESGAH